MAMAIRASAATAGAPTMAMRGSARAVVHPARRAAGLESHEADACGVHGVGYRWVVEVGAYAVAVKVWVVLSAVVGLGAHVLGRHVGRDVVGDVEDEGPPSNDVRGVFIRGVEGGLVSQLIGAHLELDEGEARDRGDLSRVSPPAPIGVLLSR